MSGYSSLRNLCGKGWKRKMPPRKRSITDEEIALIKGMLDSDIEKTKIQAYFTHPDRPVNFGRITNIEKGSYGPEVQSATQDEVGRFLSTWNAQRGKAVEAVIEEALDPRSLPPTHPRRMVSYFEQRADGIWTVMGGETDEIECKTSFHLGSKTLRAIAALANNRGGYIFFGVDNDEIKVVGLQNSRFQDTDPSKFSQAIRGAMEPTPRVEIGSFAIDKHTVGAIYVYEEPDGPVIASKTDQEFREGTIYYRYPGESRAIGAAEFRKLLSARDSRIRQQSGATIARLMDLGPRATIVDVGGATPEVTKIVREGIDEADVLRNFVRQERVEIPLAYLLRSCSTARSWLPIFYYLKQSGVPVSDVIEMVNARETSYVARKRDLLARLRGEKSAKSAAVGRVAGVLRLLLKGEYASPKNSKDAANIALAMTAIPDARLDLKKLLQLLRDSIDLIRADAAINVAVWSYIYKASARLDELYFRPT
ncbi:MAG: ATP-binding protein [Pseudolabrys sp.]|nr:ATP-binding protein [Pseudolabrys sp.]